MFNSLLDPNISLACNFLDTCRTLDADLRMGKSRGAMLGSDVNNETFPKVFAMSCYMANALRAEGITSVYKSLPFLYYYRLRQINKLPKYWISVRMFSLLPRFAEGKHKKASTELVPDFMRIVGPRQKAWDEFRNRGGHRTHGGLPLSFVPDIDAYWLGAEYIDVFKHLKKDLCDMLIPMTYSEYEDAKPFELDSETTLVGILKQCSKKKEWLTIATLFFAMFFPDRLQQVVDPSNEYGAPSTTDGWLRLLGDTMQFAPEKILLVFLQGMNAVYLALGQCGVDVLGRAPGVTQFMIYSE